MPCIIFALLSVYKYGDDIVNIDDKLTIGCKKREKIV